MIFNYKSISKKVITILLISSLLSLAACGKKETVEIFSQEIYEGITEIIYTDFQGNQTKYTDKDSIKILTEALKDKNYVKLDDKEEVPAGFYDFSFISNGNEYGFGYTRDDIIRNDGHMYEVNKDKFEKLIKLTGVKY